MGQKIVIVIYSMLELKLFSCFKPNLKCQRSVDWRIGLQVQHSGNKMATHQAFLASSYFPPATKLLVRALAISMASDLWWPSYKSQPRASILRLSRTSSGGPPSSSDGSRLLGAKMLIRFFDLLKLAPGVFQRRSTADHSTLAFILRRPNLAQMTRQDCPAN